MEDQNQVNSTNIKEIIRQEYKNCAINVPHFIKKYCWIQHPQKGRIPFHLYPFQEKVINLFHKTNEYIIVNKGRQLGVSTFVAAYALWLMLFHSDKNILVIATKQDTAKNMITKVQFMYENLPSWLKIGHTEYNKLSLKLVNGSQIKAVSAAKDSGRSEAVSLLIIDEAAFIDEIDEIYPSAQKTLATGGKCIAISTPKGVGNWFHRTFTDAEIGKGGFIAVKLPWHVHPDRDQKYRDEEDNLLGKRMAAQENDCDFTTSGDTVIDPEVLNFYAQTYVIDPVERRGITMDYWLWQQPDYSKSYMIIADVARGDDRDFSAFQVIDIVNFEQVAEFQCKLSTRDFARVLIAAGTEWNNALLVIENASIGWDVVQSVLESHYQNVYFSPKSMGDLTPETYISRYDTGQTIPGFTNSTKTRPLVISKLKECIHDKGFVFRSKRLLEELRTFIWEGGKPKASSGYNDDLVMAAGIGAFVRDVSLRFDSHNKEISKAAISNISRTQPPPIMGPMHGNRNPWQQQIGNQMHDITWLL
jgi:hypothetical protein